MENDESFGSRTELEDLTSFLVTLSNTIVMPSSQYYRIFMQNETILSLMHQAIMIFEQAILVRPFDGYLLPHNAHQ